MDVMKTWKINLSVLSLILWIFLISTCLYVFYLSVGVIPPMPPIATQHHTSTSSQKRVLILIPSLLSLPDHRQAVRQSWGNFRDWPSCQVQLRLVFYVGNPEDREEIQILESEQKQFGDVYKIDLNEDYYNLTKKTQLMITDAVLRDSKNDLPFDVLIKTDDDTFVNIPLICSKFPNLPSTHVYGGKCRDNSKPYRAQNPKFHISEEEYPRKVFPPFCEGAFYYMSKDLAKVLVRGFPNTKFLKFEDVFVGLTFESEKITFEKIDQFNYLYDFLYSWEKTAGLEVGYTRENLMYSWAMHPVMRRERLLEMHKKSIELHKKLEDAEDVLRRGKKPKKQTIRISGNKP